MAHTDKETPKSTEASYYTAGDVLLEKKNTETQLQLLVSESSCTKKKILLRPLCRLLERTYCCTEYVVNHEVHPGSKPQI